MGGMGVGWKVEKKTQFLAYLKASKHPPDKLINSLIQVAINFLERYMDTYRIRVILFSALIRVITLKQGWVLGIQFRTGYQN